MTDRRLISDPSDSRRAAAELLARPRAGRRADTWVPAFEREWAAAREESRRTFSLAPPYEVVQDRQGRLAHAPAVDAFVASGYDDSEFVDMAELREAGNGSGTG
ncbi:DUF6247 family protein [Streptomyces sp. CC219B]|uniref:DUF6247 family protein n=1 Tax=Streptomyces sp. CC219B TaxID=3044574 RepID=UPI0024A93B7B|nr:DUF6247 family protein [Streptomyces sp. CC219B]